jgi:adenosylcobinamide-GDP ribazoletransferase
MIDDMLSAFGFLTILPLTNIAGGSTPRPGKMYGYFPLVGLLIGLICVVVDSIRFMPRSAVAFLTLAVWVVMTGGLHLDGLADACDGLFATTTPERRREIMKDPHAGAWAMVGVVLILVGKFAVLQTVSPLLLIIPPVLGRWAMVLAASLFPRASETGMAARFANGFEQPQIVAASVTALVVVALVAVIMAITSGIGSVLLILVVTLVSVLVVYGVGTWASPRLGGGLTGDVYGALCELVELVSLLALTISFTIRLPF